GNGLSPARIQIFVNPNTSRDTVAYSTLPGIKGRTIFFALAGLLAATLGAAPAQAEFNFTCDASAQGMCGEYTFATEAQRQSFAERCTSMGSTTLAGHSCKKAGATGCRHVSEDMEVTTWIYGMAPVQVRQNCLDSKGQAVN
ncbi:MAG: hypothetical protein OEM59_22710, partial [Rhodospirillales bacterium]|nr:hypothetical protein [Rhodospirillales bacterium]